MIVVTIDYLKSEGLMSTGQLCGIDILVMSIVTRCNASFTVALSDGRIDHSEVLVKHGRVQE